MIALALALAMMQDAQLSHPASFLYRDCQAQVRLDDKGSISDVQTALSAQQCTAYIQGVVDGLRMSPKLVCIGNAKLQELARVFIAYLDSHPKLMDSERWPALLIALEESYPCPSK